MRHETETYDQADDSFMPTRPVPRFYMACSCGWVAPLRYSREIAEADADAHVKAAAEKAAAA